MYWYSSMILKKKLFLARLDLHCCTVFPLVAASGGYSLGAVCRLLISVAFPVAEHGP